MPYRAPKKQRPPKDYTTLHLIVGFVVILAVPRIIRAAIVHYISTATFKELIYFLFNLPYIALLFLVPTLLLGVYGVKWSLDIVSVISKYLWKKQANTLAPKDESKETIEENEQGKPENKESTQENIAEPPRTFFSSRLVLLVTVLYVTSHWIMLGNAAFIFLFITLGVTYDWHFKEVRKKTKTTHTKPSTDE